MTLDNVQALPLGTQLGDYRLDMVIGQGGFGITYRAFDSQLAKVVAIKEYLPVEFAVRQSSGQVVPRGARFADDFSWGRDRFLDEARALARFRHPHIVPVLRFLEANGTAYMVMEFEDGRSVAEWLRQTGRRMPPADVRRLAEGLLSGLGAVHEQGFLHRDIKPSNLIVRRDGVPVLIDFGAARRAIGGRTRTLTSILTPQYAPIEQYALDGKQGPWSDIYSAAAVLYHAIAGQPPPEAAGRVGQDPYKPLAVTQADRFDQTFLTAIDRALAFAPEDRPQSIEAWRASFGASLPSSDAALTQRLSGAPAAVIAAGTGEAAFVAAPRLGGVSRGQEVVPPLPPRSSRRLPLKTMSALAIVAISGVAVWQWRPEIESALAGVVQRGSSAPPQSLQPAPSTSQATPSPLPPFPTDKTLVEQAQRAAEEARAVYDKANDAVAAARSMVGEARIVAARAALPTLENAQRLTLDDGSSYVGQAVEGKRQGLGVTEFRDGRRQAGEWKNDSMDGLGAERLADGGRFEGQWRDGERSGLGVAETPGIAHDEGTFIAGKLDGPGLHRSLGEPAVVQVGDWHAGSLDGPGVESVGDKERFEGSFRTGKRNGYGQLTVNGQVTSGRWEDGNLVKSAP